MVQLDDVDRHGMDHDISMHPEAVQLKRAICYPSTGIQPMRYAGAQLPRGRKACPTLAMPFRCVPSWIAVPAPPEAEDS